MDVSFALCIALPSVKSLGKKISQTNEPLK